MTVQSTTRRNDDIGNGAAANYTFTFRIFAATDLLVTTKDTAGMQTTLVYPNDYSVTGVGLYSGGSITLTAGVLPTGTKITIRRLLPLTQTADIRNQGGYYPDVVENALDRLDMIALQHQDEIDRSIKLPETESGALTLPTFENRASNFLAFDAAGAPIAAAGVASVPISSFIETVLDDTTAAAVRATLGLLTDTVDTIAALRAYAVPATAMSISVLGYYAPGDGGGDTFYWDSASTAADNGGTIIRPNAVLAANPGRWLRIFSGAVNIRWFGAKGDGVTDDTPALTAAANTSKIVEAPYGDYVILSPVTIYAGLRGHGADDGQTIFTLTGTGQLVVGDTNAHWSGFFIRSAVNNLKFIRVPGISYWTCTDFRVEPIGAATGQVGISFDTTTASIYSANVGRFRLKCSYPIEVIGNATQVFNANRIGFSIADTWYGFQSAVSISGVLASDANEFHGYMELGTNALSFTQGAHRQNRWRIILDNVTNAVSMTVAITDPNIWEIVDGGFVTIGIASPPQNQILIGPAKTMVRATATVAQPIPTAAATKLVYDAIQFDTLGEFTLATGIFKAKRAGYYRVKAMHKSASVAWPADARWQILIYKNADVYADGDYDPLTAALTTFLASGCSTLVFMNGTTDELHARAIHNQGGSVNTDTAPTACYIEIEAA